MPTTTIADLRSPYDLAHPNIIWTWTARHGAVTAHFDNVTTLTDGNSLIAGTYVDEYGWWHKQVILDFANLPADLHRCSGYKEPEPAPFPVALTFEWRRGLIRLAIPDDDVRRLVAWKQAHWTEIPGMADGYSSAPKRGTWEHKALAYLHSVQSHTTDRMPFIEGVGFDATKNEHGHGGDWDLFLSTCGISSDPSPNARFYFAG